MSEKKAHPPLARYFNHAVDPPNQRTNSQIDLTVEVIVPTARAVKALHLTTTTLELL